MVADCEEPLKRVPDNERLAALGTHEHGHSLEVEPQALSREQIAELKPFVDFQSHTVPHPILPYCDRAKAWSEINDSKRQLESSYGLSVFALSYPNGDYPSREVRLAEEASYVCGIRSTSASTPLKRISTGCGGSGSMTRTTRASSWSRRAGCGTASSDSWPNRLMGTPKNL